MEYISSDTNVWIDYMVIDRIDLPFRLPFVYIMSKDAIEDELLSPKGMKEKLLRLGLLEVELTEEEFYEGIHLSSVYPKLSIYDCSALSIAKCRRIVLLTGDAALRKAAQTEGVTVAGTIGILDKLYDDSLITLEEYKTCLSLLIKANGKEVRLPTAELMYRLEQCQKKATKENTQD